MRICDVSCVLSAPAARGGAAAGRGGAAAARGGAAGRGAPAAGRGVAAKTPSKVTQCVPYMAR